MSNFANVVFSIALGYGKFQRISLDRLKNDKQLSWTDISSAVVWGHQLPQVRIDVYSALFSKLFGGSWTGRAHPKQGTTDQRTSFYRDEFSVKLNTLEDELNKLLPS